jgi:tetratricopeptide (TPR) repeat protein
LLDSYLSQQKSDPEFLLSNQQADFYYVLLQFYYGNKTIAWNHTQAHTTDYTENMMSCYLRAFMASHCARTDEAISILNKQPRGEDYHKYYDLDFIMGYAKLNKGEPDADIEFKKFVTFSKNSSLKKDAYRRLAWSELLQKDNERFLTYRRLAFSVSSFKDDEDILVDKDLAKGICPNTQILKARLLFDGGYYTQAEDIMKNVNPATLKGYGQPAEYYYRYGRIMQEQKKYAKAIEYFTESINLGEKKNLYFAPYSALQLGNVYAKLGYAQTAVFYYNKAIGYKNYKDQGYITQKAKQASAELSTH